MSTVLPEWFYPAPPGGWTADMLDHLPPDAPRHVELIDGSLIKYSDAGIKHFRRVEQEDGIPVVYTFELEPAVTAYVPTGIHRRRLRTNIGFDVDVDLDLEKVRR
ncbi:hypothetical protein HD597_006373 [Nonomuraea thailandensis]|uniref:Restriction endonuclease n=1 Tax=Nonomuraea thailandensis TaxID=1188745 RepID=A0A9X2GRY0_9ACTN|nr:hypothetical protein [Nonomuraea thailandensis]MCP2359353.1 hypothetical protein [Nonomuraea thailandensis]